MTGNGVARGGVAAEIYGIGVDVDQTSYPSRAACILTSAEKHLSGVRRRASRPSRAASPRAACLLRRRQRRHRRLAVLRCGEQVITADTQAKLDEALAGMKAGTLKTCPAKCGTLPVSQP